MIVDWDYIRRAERAQAQFGTRTVGHWHSHPDSATPSESDLRLWANSLDRENSGVFVGIIVTEGQPYLRWHVWTTTAATAK